MPVERSLWRAVGVLLAVVVAVGCSTSTAQMTPQQREGVELRRYCEQHPEDVERCLGFLGFR